MSRIAKAPITVPSGVEVVVNGQNVAVKGNKGELVCLLNDAVVIKLEEGVIRFAPAEGFKDGWAQAGTARANVNNMVLGVTEGFKKTLLLQGVGYRAQVAGTIVNLTLGFSHPVAYQLPEGITAVAKSQTEIILEGADKQVVGQAAAKIRAFRPPEPYKGKGVRYANEIVRRKEAKKK
ncbi:LSU ribosomal protein L6P [Psychromonas ingrahamii 37]|uniref:Large ribosomal subunit protein uL6 n=1 Tax=Psychromonas ingrahamii (strain DSM 17664 / CCUG 51855 / 37) TaxID=357804 RepID=RL6_PSYIN|nr:50S ribosomal protein L6 [Psychromonas ingrahamii]A1T0C7.1 RecName: Full=Large ribosomal subunit protein uL6; AltName: Full=50S ribosomal protein L6 [Psychromonas ingrahamii 37]ABM05192.1 LSU ribosomal protein L6P [Psychromonas ingrahamii 37]